MPKKMAAKRDCGSDVGERRSPSGQQLVFLSFADSRLSESMNRLKEQVNGSSIFDRYLFCDELDLSAQFVRKNSWAFSRRRRGFGYFLWKPYLIERALLKLRDGDVLVYSDVGNHFEWKNGARVREYVDLASSARTPILAPQLSSKYLEQYWTKREMVRFFGVEHDALILRSPQFEANFILVVNRPRSREMIRKWNEVHEREPSLFDDSQSATQSDGFIEHRHDQSAFSILGKIYEIVRLPPDRDDLVLRKRDTQFRRSNVQFFFFLLRNHLLLHRLFSHRSV